MTYYRDGAVDPQFAKLMLTLAEALGAKLTESRIRIYARLLGDVPYEQLRVAFTRAANEEESGFLPTVGKLRRYISPSEDDAVVLAWTALAGAAETVGAWQSIEVEDGAAAEALLAAFGSWQAYCETEHGPALALKRQEFFAAYRQAVRTGAGRRPWKRLPGASEASGQAHAAGGRHTWAARLTAHGLVEAVRDTPRLSGGGTDGRAALPEGRDTQGREGAE
jgi:hypothetical protein